MYLAGQGVDAWAALNADPVVMEHFRGTATRAESDAFLDRHRALIEDQGWGLWAVGCRRRGRGAR